MTIMNMSESEQFDIIREASNYLNVLVNIRSDSIIFVITKMD